MVYTIESWIDEMNILKADKTARIDTARSLDKELGKFFIRQLSDFERGLFLTEVSSESYRDMLIDLYMMYSDSATDEWMLNKSQRFADQIQKTTESTIRGIEGGSAFTSTLLFGSPIMRKDIPKKVLETLSQDRAMRIAMNETNIIHNYKHHIELSKNQITHTWDATLDAVTRPHHWDADGKTVPINEPFVIAGERLMFPGDDSLGATAKNLINCRCIEL